MGSLYKLLAKVFKNRLKEVIAKVLSDSYNDFLQGRQILDTTLIANEAIDLRLRSQKGGVVCKLYIEKAYDHVN